MFTLHTHTHTPPKPSQVNCISVSCRSALAPQRVNKRPAERLKWDTHLRLVYSRMPAMLSSARAGCSRWADVVVVCVCDVRVNSCGLHLHQRMRRRQFVTWPCRTVWPSTIGWVWVVIVLQMRLFRDCLLVFGQGVKENIGYDYPIYRNRT